MNDIFIVPLRNSTQLCLVDIEDRERVMEHIWYINDDRIVCRLFSGGPQRSLHRFILSLKDKKMVDHENHLFWDCRRSNLRPCSNRQNQGNQLKRPGCSSQYKGVYWDKCNQKWSVKIRRKALFYGEANKIHIGSFDNEINAALAYNKKAKEIFGRFALLNKIPGHVD